MLLHAGVTTVSIAGLAIGVWVGIRGLRQDFSIAFEANQQLRQAYEVGLHVAFAKRCLSEEPPHRDWAQQEIQRAELILMDRAALGPREASPVDVAQPGWLPGSRDDVERMRAALRIAALSLDPVPTAKGAEGVAATSAIAALDQSLASLAHLSSQTRTTIVQRQQAADAKHRTTLLAVAILSSLVIVGAGVSAIRQYRRVLMPLSCLSQTVRRIAAGSRDERAAPVGDEEFVALSRDFNRMASELDALLAELEQRVQVKSRELVRSERLASVGYLAAGVAHEINNPLGIIAGFGERSLQHLQRGLDAATASRVQKSLEVICEEAFRCKGITDRLLSLARTGAERRQRVSLAAVAKQVISNVEGLPKYKDRRVTLEALEAGQPAEQFLILGAEAELKQVLLNLVINALNSVRSASGQVWVTLRRLDDAVEVQVRDNGHGMTPDVLDRVFEPFFSERSDREAGTGTGTGLGLSITHAIVAEHGGTIRAESAGIGKGSVFTVMFPAAIERAKHAATA
jgi:signal transduction histidine kinase